MDKENDMGMPIISINVTAKARRIKTTHHHFWG
jgi:hypothetical protein